MNFDLNILLSLALVEQLGFLWETFSLSCFKTKQVNEVPPMFKMHFLFWAEKSQETPYFCFPKYCISFE